jgi:hypothetical protein
LNKPGIPVAWFMNDLPIESALEPDTFTITQTDTKYTLTIPECKTKHQGLFSLKVPDTNIKTSAILTVDEAPAEFVNGLENKSVKEDESVEFVCEINKPDTKVKWMLNGQRLVPDENIEITVDGNKRILKIKKCQLEDSGKVSCVLPGDKASKANLMVEEVKIDIKMENVEVFEKEDAKLEATISKKMNKRDVSWLLKANKISESLKYNHDCETDLLVHRLTVRDCTLEDSGDYTVQVRNDQFTIKLLVKGKFFLLLLSNNFLFYINFI